MAGVGLGGVISTRGTASTPAQVAEIPQEQ